MNVPVQFHGGPYDGDTGHAYRLHKYQIFVHTKDREIFVYAYKGELQYEFKDEYSKAATKNYDNALRQLQQKEPNGVFFIEEDSEGGGD